MTSEQIIIENSLLHTEITLKRVVQEMLSSSSGSLTTSGAPSAHSAPTLVMPGGCTNVLCTELPKHWRVRKLLPRPAFTVISLHPIPDGCHVELSASNCDHPCIRLTGHQSQFEGQHAQFPHLRFAGKSGRGRQLHLTISIRSEPVQIVTYMNAIKVTTDGPRNSRNKTETGEPKPKIERHSRSLPSVPLWNYVCPRVDLKELQLRLDDNLEILRNAQTARTVFLSPLSSSVGRDFYTALFHAHESKLEATNLLEPPSKVAALECTPASSSACPILTQEVSASSSSPSSSSLQYTPAALSHFIILAILTSILKSSESSFSSSMSFPFVDPHHLNSLALNLHNHMSIYRVDENNNTNIDNSFNDFENYINTTFKTDYFSENHGVALHHLISQ